MANKSPITYHVAFKDDFDNAISCESQRLHLITELRLQPQDLISRYYIKPPQYKSWVPYWLINLITKKP